MQMAAPGRGVIGFVAAAPAAQSAPLGPLVLWALQALMAQAAAVIESINLYRMQAEQAAVSTALLQVATAVGTTDLDTLVQRTLAVLPDLFGGQVAALLYLDHRRSELRLLEPKQAGGPLTALTEARVAPAKLELLAPVLRGTEPTALEEAETAQLLPTGLVESRRLRAALIIPLHLSNRPADALGVFWSTAPHRFRPRDLETARGVSELVGVALANAQLFTEARDRAEELASLYRTGQMMSSSLDLDELLRTITAAAVDLTRSKICMIYLINPKTGLLDVGAGTGLDGREQAPTALRPDVGLLGRCVLLGKPLLINDLEEESQTQPFASAGVTDLHGALFLPLITSGEVIGVLGTAADVPGYYLPEHQQILQAFAHQAAVAIERARL
jgi:GAF domain-containing protein